MKAAIAVLLCLISATSMALETGERLAPWTLLDQHDQAYTLDGEPVAAGQRKDLGFNANLLGEDLGEFRRRQPQHLALKHAHGKRNPEKDWGLYTLQALQTAFYVLNRQFPEADLRPENTLVIAASISNGGGAVLREINRDRLKSHSTVVYLRS